MDAKMKIGVLVSLVVAVYGGIHLYSSSESVPVSEVPVVEQKKHTSPSTPLPQQFDLKKVVMGIEKNFPLFVEKMLKNPLLQKDEALMSMLRGTKMLVENNARNPNKFAEDLLKHQKDGEPYHFIDMRYISYMQLSDFSRGNVAEFGAGMRVLSLGEYQGSLLDHVILFHELVHALQDLEARSQIATEADVENYKKQLEFPLMNAEGAAYDYELLLLYAALQEKKISKSDFLTLPPETFMKHLGVREVQGKVLAALQIIGREHQKFDMNTPKGREGFASFLAEIYAQNTGQPQYVLSEETGEVRVLTLQKT